MTCNDDSVRARLDDWLDGVLAPARAAAVARHLEDCPDCRRETEALRGLLAAAAALPAAVTPPDGLWDGIASRLASPARALAPAPAARRRRVTPATWTWSGWIAAAACLAFALLARGPRGDARTPSARPADDPAAVAVAGALRELEAGNRQAQAEYAAVLQARPSRGDVARPGSVDLNRSLETVDLALTETRAALTADPGNPLLARLLTRGYAQRIDILRRATRLAMHA